MLDTFLAPVLPPATVVGRDNLDVIKAIAAYEQFEAQLPPRRSADQINKLDELRSDALMLLGDEFFEGLDEEAAGLLDTLTAEVAKVRAHWDRLEQIRGLRKWRSEGLRSYSPQQIPTMTLSSGAGGYKQQILARALFQALADTLKRLGGH